MYRLAENRLSRIIRSGGSRLLAEGRIGIEKESLRVTPQGGLAQTPHPHALGSPLTHPFITTDYSEAMPEFITPVCDTSGEALDFLRDTQRFVYEHLQEEILWATSMPCIVAGETSIPIAYYGTSNAGTMKTVYRRGLGHRYGRAMQVIAGVHFNYSFSGEFWALYQDLEQDGREARDFISDSYFALIRNLQRFGWLVPYLFGASPAVCKSFLGGKQTDLESFDKGTYFEPFATSLRMGDIGYQNNKEAKIGIKACYDNIDVYIESLSRAIETPHPGYEKLGVVMAGRYEQLNPNILQIENEYYSTIRPKQVTGTFEKPVNALKQRGVRYVELRSLDVNAFDPLGINERQLNFLEAFLIFCLLHESPLIGLQERDHIDQNELVTAHRGRDPELKLFRKGKEVTLKQWATEVLDAMAGVCEILDADDPARPYTSALQVMRERVQDPDATPSARMLAAMREQGTGFFDFALDKSLDYQAYFASLELSSERREMFVRLAEESWQQQRAMEEADQEPFEDYLQRYYAQRI